MKEISFFIPGSPLSSNKLYTRQKQNRRKIILTDEGRRYKANLWNYLGLNCKAEAGVVKAYLEAFPGKKVVEVEVHSFDNWLTKEDKPKKKDVQNQTKALVDTVFTFFGLDDSNIFDERAKKVHCLKDHKVGVLIYMRLVPLEKFIVK